MLVLLAFWVIAWLAVPPIAKSQIQKIASEKLGRQVTVGKVDFKPWTLELTLSDLRIATADGSKSQVAIQRIYADGELQSIFRLAPVVDAVTVDGPAILLTHQADGKYDIDDILAKLSAGPPPDPNAKPARFAIYNIAINGGSVDFDDQTVHRKHELRDFVLQVPFLSNLASKRDVNTEPKLAFTLNGSKFDSAAFTAPFSENRKTDAHVQFKGLDLVPYLGYIPGGLPVRLQAGSLDADLKIGFEQGATTGLKITGTVEAHTAKVADARGRDLLGFESLKLALADVRPLESVFHLSEIALVNPQLAVARDAAGQLNLLATDPATGATEKAAPLPAAAASAPAGKPAEKAALKVQVDKVALSGGRIGWRDETVKPAAAVDLTDLGIDVTGVTWPMEKPAEFNGGTAIAGASLKFKGSATDKVADVQTEVDALPLSLAAPYLAQSLEPTLDGKLSGQIDIAWAQPELKFKARRLSADGLALTQAKTALASVGRFELVDAEVDMTKHTLNVASFTATNPKVRVERDNEKRWMFERWLKTPAGGGTKEVEAKVAAPKPAAAQAPQPGANTKPWALTIGTVAVDNGSLSYSDKASATPVAVEVTAFKLNAQKIAPDTNTVSPLQVSGRIGSAGRSADPGRFDYKGNLVLKPLAAEGRLEIASFPAHAFKAYYADALNVDIRRAFASYRGTVHYTTTPAGMSVKLAGDTALDDFRANSVSLTQSPGFDRNNNQLLSWKTLSLRGLQVSMAPNTAPAVDVRETTLTDFFARVIVDPTGRLNLLNLTKKGEAEANAAAAAAGEASTRKGPGGTTTTTRAAPAPKATGGAPVSAEAMVGGAPEPAKPAAAAAPVATAQAADAGLAPVINFGPMSLVNGKIDFTDLFVKPNYSADLSELTGKLSSFSSNPPKGEGGRPALADLELRGKAQQTAALEITGKLNPLAKPLELDITAKMRDLDLAPLSPYSVRYAGHGIERGKMSMDVNYKVAADGQLTATNKLVLNQLQFGDEVAGAPASLPVKLAVALLADRNGVIDVDLPLSGSLNDPQFSVGPLIWKAVVNLIGKAITAPFSLLTGGLGGGSGESSAITFEPGSSTLSDSAKESLGKVVKALTDRPSLQMTVIGTSSLEKERDAYQRQRLRQLTLAEKRRIAVRGGQTGTDVPPVTDAEYPELLTAVYKRADITKPRNMVGLAKDLPVKEMENLLLASVPVDEESMRQLAVERGAAVRDYLLAQKLPSERLFLGAVRTTASGADWKPGAELSLTMK
ncbi:OmpA family protein [Variovorax sp. EL159]|nr:OmpA family protein [Variovorax sp. EL159]